MPDDFHSLAEIFESDPGLGTLRNTVKQYDLINEFDKIFPELGKVAKAAKTDKKILFLKVENSVWRSELRFMEKVIVEKVNIYFKEERIKGVKFLP